MFIKETPQLVLKPHIIISLNLSFLVKLSLLWGKIFLFIELIYLRLFFTFQNRLSPLNECADGPIPRYFFPCQYAELFTLYNLSNAKLDNSTITVTGDTGSHAVDLGDTLTVEGGTGIATTVTADKVSIAIDGVVLTETSTDTLTNKTITASNNTIGLDPLNIDGGTDIGADLTTSDLIIVDDGANGTNRKAALSRMITLVQENIDDPTALAIALG